MYESRETSIRGIVVTILLIILVICAFLWLFPLKKDDNGTNNNNNNEVVLSKKFSYNLKILQNAGRAYYYSATLPKNVGNKVKITLKELIAKKMTLELKDEKEKSCDNDASYVELTKKSSNEFELKSYLKCGEEADFITYTLKCSDFKNNCKTAIVKNVVKVEEKKNEEVDTKNANNNQNDTRAYYRYLYRCPKTEISYSNWSEWSKTAVTKTSTREVETKIVNEPRYTKVGTETVYETTQVIIPAKEEIKEYVNTHPQNVKCVSIPNGLNTIYKCTIRTEEHTETVTTTKTQDKYEWVQTPVTYYRYRTLTTHLSYNEIWYNGYNETYMNNGCTIVATEKYYK